MLSSPVSILCATKPSKLAAAPVTSVTNDMVTIDWSTPTTNGLPITAYSIFIRTGDQLTYITDNSVCNGISNTVIAQTSCDIPLSTLTAAPYNLLKGYSIYAYVISTNAYGSSPASDYGNGGVIVLVPDAPINLVDNIGVTSRSVISFSWAPAASDGGTAILDYTILYDESYDNMGTVLKTGHTDTTYTTDFAILPGRTYKFQVKARNSVGSSLASAVLTILAAQKPVEPTNV